MSDIERIQQRIAEIKSRLETDPKTLEKIALDAQRDHEKIAQAEAEMRRPKVVPITQASRRKIRRPDDGSEVEL